MDLRGKVAAVTGAARGIGEATAIEFARRGCDIAVSDIDGDGVEETAEQARRFGVEASARELDVSDREGVHAWADEVAEEFGQVNFIVNNAGVSVTGTIENISYEDFEWLMNINFWGVINGTKAFLPHIRRAGKGRVVNISSAFGLVASPTQSAYNASKFAVRGFTESLRAELSLEGTEVSATCVHPGGIDTAIVRSSRISDTGPMERTPEEVIEEFENDLVRTSPEDAATTIVDGVEKGKGRILVGSDARVADIVSRLFPAIYPEPLAFIARESWKK